MSITCTLQDIDEAFADYNLFLNASDDECYTAMLIFANTFAEKELADMIRTRVEIYRAYRHN